MTGKFVHSTAKDMLNPFTFRRGSSISSRLVNYFPERVTALAFLATGYFPPTVDVDVHRLLTTTKQVVGYELFGYWLFFDEDGADEIVRDHVRVRFPSSAYCLLTGNSGNRSRAFSSPPIRRCGRRISDRRGQ